jgi:hypothetical protein
MDNFEKLECGECGIVFAISQTRLSRLKNSHKTFWCPSGHGRYFQSESEEEKLKKKVNELSSTIIQKNLEIDKLKNPPVLKKKRGRKPKK